MLFLEDIRHAYPEWVRRLRETLADATKDCLVHSSSKNSLFNKWFLEGRWLSQWNPPKGTYHNYGHLCDVHAELRRQGVDVPSVLLAALYHDFGYDAKDSEQNNIGNAIKSARSDLICLGVSDSLIRAVEALILKTGEHSKHMTNPLVLADLSIFRASPDVYRRYAEAIRNEYLHIADETFFPGREKLLKQMKRTLGEAGLPLSRITEEISNLQGFLGRKEVHLLYAGSFDPFHKGHAEVVRKAVDLGYHVTLVILDNPGKTPVAGLPVRYAVMGYELFRKFGRHPLIHIAEDTPSSLSVTGALALLGCSHLLRGVRTGNASSEVEERDRALVIKQEAGIETLLVGVSGASSVYSSSAAKALIKNMYPTRAVGPLTRLVYGHYLGRRIRIEGLLVGGIASGKSTWANNWKQGSQDRYVIDLDYVAGKYLALHPRHSKDTRESRLAMFSSLKKYRKTMNRLMPTILAGLHTELGKVPDGGTILIVCNTLGLLYKDLLRICDFRVMVMPPVVYEEAYKRVIKRGSSEQTFIVVRMLEDTLCDLLKSREDEFRRERRRIFNILPKIILKGPEDVYTFQGVGVVGSPSS